MYSSNGTKRQEDYVFNMTRVISNSTADAAGDCYLAGYDVFFYYYLKSTGFIDAMDYLSAFLQNLIGNIISFNSIY